MRLKVLSRGAALGRVLRKVQQLVLHNSLTGLRPIFGRDSMLRQESQRQPLVSEADAAGAPFSLNGERAGEEVLMIVDGADCVSRIAA